MKRLVVLLILPAVLGGCGSKTHAQQRTLTVLGAASLTEAFQAIAVRFERSHRDVHVRLGFGPSDGLAQQIQQGAPADVFASASETWMNAVARRPGVGARADFARNRLTVIVPASNPAHITSVAGLARPGVRLVLAAKGVPAGDYGRQILARAGIAHRALANVVSNEVDVKGVLAKVASGDADAGIVYVTDVIPSVAGGVRTIPIPPQDNVVATYPIAVVHGSGDVALARAFVRFVLGPGQSVLSRDGFAAAG